MRVGAVGHSVEPTFDQLIAQGLGEKEFRQIADWIIEVVDGLAANGEDGNAAVENKVKADVKALCARFPIYPNL